MQAVLIFNKSNTVYVIEFCILVNSVALIGILWTSTTARKSLYLSHLFTLLSNRYSLFHTKLWIPILFTFQINRKILILHLNTGHCVERTDRGAISTRHTIYSVSHALRRVLPTLISGAVMHLFRAFWFSVGRNAYARHKKKNLGRLA